MPLCCHSVTQSCPTLCDPMDCSTPGFPVPHYLRVTAWKSSPDGFHRLSSVMSYSPNPAPPPFNTHTHTHTGLPAGSPTCRHLLPSGSLHWLTCPPHTNMVNCLFKWLFMPPSQWGLPWPILNYNMYLYPGLLISFTLWVFFFFSKF